MNMKDLDDFGQAMESEFGVISSLYLIHIHEMSVKAGSKWDIEKPETMDIIVTKDNADQMYDYCKAIRSGYSVGLKKGGMKLIREARLQAHRFLYEEANDPQTTIERKIELVRLTSKTDREP